MSLTSSFLTVTNGLELYKCLPSAGDAGKREEVSLTSDSLTAEEHEVGKDVPNEFTAEQLPKEDKEDKLEPSPLKRRR